MYIILDEDVRSKFEEDYQIPYGYGDADCYIYEDYDSALRDFDEVAGEGMIIENYDKGYRHIVHRYEESDCVDVY